MTKCAPGRRLFTFLFLACSLVGFTACSQLKRSGFDDEKDPHYLEAKRRALGSDWDGAIESYERALQSNPNNSAAHRELGIIYYQHKNDHPAAIYHYQRHLKLDPKSPMAQIIQGHIDFSKRAIARTHGITPVDREIQSQLERLNMTNDLLRKRIEFLEAQLARGPSHITTYVTQYVRFPEFQPGGSRDLTRPAEIVERPDQQEPEPEPPARVETPQRRAPEVARNTRNQDAAPRGSRASSATENRRSQPAASAAARTHRVRPGETMDVLARKYGVSVSALKAANPGTARGVRSGQSIKIPAK